jgi:hypothetical protein
MKKMTDAQRFTELTGGCWHEYDKIIGLYNKCSCGKICGNLDEHIKQSNPTYSNAADILNRMKEFCGIDKYEDFICTIGSITPLFDEPPIYSIEEKFILNPAALLKKAMEFLETKGE